MRYSNKPNRELSFAEDTIESAVIDLSILFQKYPFYFINEETLRNMLYAKIIRKFPEKQLYIKKPNGEEFISGSIHTDPYIVRGDSKHDSPDLLIFYKRNGKGNPILTTHRFSGCKNSEGKYRRKVWFYATNKQAGTTLDDRIFIEIKVNKNFKKLSYKKRKKIFKDIGKMQRWNHSKSYMLYFDRSNLLNHSSLSKIRDFIGSKECLIDFIYSGYSDSDEKGRYLHLKSS